MGCLSPPFSVLFLYLLWMASVPCFSLTAPPPAIIPTASPCLLPQLHASSLVTQLQSVHTLGTQCFGPLTPLTPGLRGSPCFFSKSLEITEGKGSPRKGGLETITAGHEWTAHFSSFPQKPLLGFWLTDCWPGNYMYHVVCVTHSLHHTAWSQAAWGFISGPSLSGWEN